MIVKLNIQHIYARVLLTAIILFLNICIINWGSTPYSNVMLMSLMQLTNSSSCFEANPFDIELGAVSSSVS